MLKDILNYIKVSDTISTSGQPTKEQIENISKNDFEVIINLALHSSNNALENEDYIVSSYGMSYIHIPISWDKPEKSKLNIFLLTLEALQKQNKKVFIHCAKNYRVSMFIYLYNKKVRKQKDALPILPDLFMPNDTWEEFMKSYS